MRIYIFHRDAAHTRLDVKHYLRELSPEVAQRVELVNVDSPDGDTKAKVYDIVSYPATLVAQDDGQQVRLWQGEFPPRSELGIYL